MRAFCVCSNIYSTYGLTTTTVVEAAKVHAGARNGRIIAYMVRLPRGSRKRRYAWAPRTTHRVRKRESVRSLINSRGDTHFRCAPTDRTCCSHCVRADAPNSTRMPPTAQRPPSALRLPKLPGVRMRRAFVFANILATINQTKRTL